MTDAFGTPISAIQCQPSAIPKQIFGSNQPVVLKGLVNHWPVVEHSKSSAQKAIDYLLQYYNKQPVRAFLADDETEGRIFYNQDANGFNFVQTQVYLDDVLNKIVAIADQESVPTYYLGSLEIADTLPGFSDHNDLDIPSGNVRKSIWLGNRSLVAPHFDFPDNIACCVLGERRFTLFPPEQLENLYIGPMDITPGGQQISMVNVKQPDLDKYPKFVDAMDAAVTATLAPGDAIYVPSMWWHNVESISPVNGLVNFWWNESADYYGSPNNALLHAMLSIKSLPERQRSAWKRLFDNYVFEQPDDFLEHLPDPAKQRFDDINENTARKIRAQLLNNLK